MSQTERLHANWRYFALTYFLVVAACAFAVIGLTYAEMTMGMNVVPVGADAALPVLAFLVSVILAGLRYAASHADWGGRDRHHLALIYSFTSLVVAGVVGAALFSILALVIGGFEQMAAGLTDIRFIVFLGIVLLIYMAFSYTLSRVVLFRISRRGHGRAEPAA